MPFKHTLKMASLMLRVLYPKNFYREIEDLGDGKILETYGGGTIVWV